MRRLQQLAYQFLVSKYHSTKEKENPVNQYQNINILQFIPSRNILHTQ